MSKLGVQLSVDDFENYRSRMLDAQRIAVDTQRVINGLQNPTFGNFQTPPGLKQLPADVRKAAGELDAITRRMLENKRAQDALLSTTARSLAESSRGVQTLAPNIAKAREEQERLNRSAEAYARIQGRSGGVNGSLSNAERYGRINLARQGADVFTQLGSGASPGLVTIQQGPQIAEALAMSGGKIATTMSAAGKAMLAFGPALALGAAGAAVVYKITGDIRAESERQLKVQERITAAWNEQAMKIKQVAIEMKDLDKRLDAAAVGRSIDRDIAFTLEAGDRRQIEIAQQRIKEEIRIRKGYARDTDSDEEKAANALFLSQQESRLQQLNIELEKRSRTGFAPGENSAWFAEQSKKAQAFADDVKKAQERVVEIGKAWRENFSSLVARTYEDNAFVKIFIDGRTEMEKFKEGIRGLPKEIQDSMIASQQAFNAKQLFGAKIDSAMNAFDLREMAAEFRNIGNRRLTPADVEKMQYQFLSGGTQNIDAYRLNSDRNFLYSGSGAEDFRRLAVNNGITSIGPRFLDTVDGFEGFARRQFDNLDAMGAGSDLNRSALASVLAREKLNPESKFGSPAEKLDRQLAALDRLNPSNTGEQALLDQRILRNASGIDPATLRSDQRERLAQIADRAADREEKRHQEALEVQKQMAASLKILTGEEKKLSDEAARGGTQAVEIRIKNEAGSDVETKRSSQADVDREFRERAQANVMYGGSNQGSW